MIFFRTTHSTLGACAFGRGSFTARHVIQIKVARVEYATI